MGSKKSKSWKVTAKKGAGGAPPPAAAGAVAPGAAGGGAAADAPRVSVWRRLRNALTLKHKPYALEMALALYYSSMAFAAFWMANWLMGGYCTAMALVFFSLSFGDYFM